MADDEWPGETGRGRARVWQGIQGSGSRVQRWNGHYDLRRSSMISNELRWFGQKNKKICRMRALSGGAGATFRFRSFQVISGQFRSFPVVFKKIMKTSTDNQNATLKRERALARKQVPSRLDPFTETLLEMDTEQKTLNEMMAWLKTQAGQILMAKRNRCCE